MNSLPIGYKKYHMIILLQIVTLINYFFNAKPFFQALNTRRIKQGIIDYRS